MELDYSFGSDLNREILRRASQRGSLRVTGHSCRVRPVAVLSTTRDRCRDNRRDTRFLMGMVQQRRRARKLLGEIHRWCFLRRTRGSRSPHRVRGARSPGSVSATIHLQHRLRCQTPSAVRSTRHRSQAQSRAFPTREPRTRQSSFDQTSDRSLEAVVRAPNDRRSDPPLKDTHRRSSRTSGCVPSCHPNQIDLHRSGAYQIRFSGHGCQTGTRKPGGVPKRGP